MRIITGDVRVDGARSSPLSWQRFSYAMTKKTGGLRLLKDVILNNFTSCTIDAPWTHRDLVEQIATHSSKVIPINLLPRDLEQSVSGRRGVVVRSFPGDFFDRIVLQYDAMQWWVSEKGLTMGIVEGPKDLSFNAFAGKLMAEARERRLKNGRLAVEEYKKIAVKLDEAGFTPVKNLEDRFRKKLATWNQKNPRKAVHSFVRALEAKSPSLQGLRRAVMKRLSRAESRAKQF